MTILTILQKFPHFTPLKKSPRILEFISLNAPSIIALFSENTLYIEDGDSDFVEITDDTARLTIYDDDYTVETWLYPTNFNGSYNYFISKGTSPSAREWAFSISASDIKVYWSTNGASSGDTTITGTVSNSLNQWVNLTFTKVGKIVFVNLLAACIFFQA